MIHRNDPGRFVKRASGLWTPTTLGFAAAPFGVCPKACCDNSSGCDCANVVGTPTGDGSLFEDDFSSEKDGYTALVTWEELDIWQISAGELLFSSTFVLPFPTSRVPYAGYRRFFCLDYPASVGDTISLSADCYLDGPSSYQPNEYVYVGLEVRSYYYDGPRVFFFKKYLKSAAGSYYLFLFDGYGLIAPGVSVSWSDDEELELQVVLTRTSSTTTSVDCYGGGNLLRSDESLTFTIEAGGSGAGNCALYGAWVQKNGIDDVQGWPVQFYAHFDNLEFQSSYGS